MFSPLNGQDVATSGVVTGTTRKGFFIQDPDGDVNAAESQGVFVLERGKKPTVGSLVAVLGSVVDYQPDEDSRPTTQILAKAVQELEFYGPEIKPVWLTAANVLGNAKDLAVFLNSLEGMLVGVAAGATFTAPSNPFGDYVVAPAEADLVRTGQGGVLIDPERPERWLPGFRLLNYDEAPTVNVGAELLEAVIGPLNFRVASFQIAAASPVRVKPARVKAQTTNLKSDQSGVTILTLNGFNLDAHREDPSRVKDPRRDVDDDVGDQRFNGLGGAIAHDAAGPAIVALQEIQDDDGAERTEVVGAERTYAFLIAAVQRAGGPNYEWLDIPPEVEADGGQPGGNIRNAYLYDPQRVQHVAGTLQRLGADSPAFEGSRKPLAARFRMVDGGGELEVINVHLASKRHQNGLFAPEAPGFDSRAALRVEQARVVGEHLAQLREQEIDYYVTGDFNDFEFSATLRELTGDHSTNLVYTVPEALRYDYNHRGVSQALMHGVVANRQLEGRRADYEILHANALLGSRPGRTGEKASDHAYVIARLEVR